MQWMTCPRRFNSLFGILAVQTTENMIRWVLENWCFNSLFGILAVQTNAPTSQSTASSWVSIPCSEFWLFRPQ